MPVRHDTSKCHVHVSILLNTGCTVEVGVCLNTGHANLTGEHRAMKHRINAS